MRYIIWVLLFLLPFFILPHPLLTFETPKVVAAEILIEFLLVVHLFKGSFTVSKKRGFILSLSSIVVLTLLHLLFYSTNYTFLGNPYRMQGVFLLWHLVLLSFISSTYVFDETNRFLSSISFVGLIGSGLMFGANESGRAFATVGEPNSLAAAGLFLWPWLLFISYKKKTQLLLTGLGLFGAVVLIYLSGSRSGLIGFTVQLIYFVLVRFFKMIQPKVLCISCALVIMSMVLPFVENVGLLENRKEIWYTALVAGWQHPLVGGGFGNTEYQMQKAAHQLENSIRFQNVDSAHNLFLDWWVQGGIVGVVLLVYLLWNSVKTFIMKQNMRETLLLFGVVVPMLFNPVSVCIVVALWWLIGRGFARDKNESKDSIPRID